MDNLVMSSATVGIVISLLAYEIGLAAQRKWKLAVLNPLLISIVLVIAFLLVFHVDYESYNLSAKYLSYLLTPATVCLAIPLYLQLDLLKKNILAILGGVFQPLRRGPRRPALPCGADERGIRQRPAEGDGGAAGRRALPADGRFAGRCAAHHPQPLHQLRRGPGQSRR